MTLGLPIVGADVKVWANDLRRTLGRQWDRLSWRTTGQTASDDGIILWDGTGGYPVVSLAGEWVPIGFATSTLRTVTGTATVSAADDVILANAVDGAVVIQLPTAITMTGRQLSIKKIDNASNTITLDPSGVELIDGGETHVFNVQYGARTIISDGSAWWII
jgi:hypothetical protein